MASRAQRHQSLAELLGELGAKVTETTELLEGAPAERVPSDDTETRECENCGKQKPAQEMSTVFLPGTGESYQCEECRCGPDYWHEILEKP